MYRQGRLQYWSGGNRHPQLEQIEKPWSNNIANGIITEDVENIIWWEKAPARILYSSMWNKNLSKETNKRIFTSIAKSIIIYGGEM